MGESGGGRFRQTSMKVIHRCPFLQSVAELHQSIQQFLPGFVFVQIYEVCSPVNYLFMNSFNLIGFFWLCMPERFVFLFSFSDTLWWAVATMVPSSSSSTTIWGSRGRKGLVCYLAFGMRISGQGCGGYVALTMGCF